MCNFHIGQKVIYVGPDREFDPNPGKTIHTIQAIRKSNCKCDDVEIDVGVRRPVNGYACQDCGHKHYEKTNIYWKSSDSFRPIIEDYTEAEIEAVNIDELVEPEYEYA